MEESNPSCMKHEASPSIAAIGNPLTYPFRWVGSSMGFLSLFPSKPSRHHLFFLSCTVPTFLFRFLSQGVGIHTCTVPCRLIPLSSQLFLFLSWRNERINIARRVGCFNCSSQYYLPLSYLFSVSFSLDIELLRSLYLIAREIGGDYSIN